MEKHLLSKSTFIKSLQCPKSLYLYKKRYFLRDKIDPVQLAKFKRGTKIGIIAQQLFPGGIDAGPKSPSQYQKAFLKTQELIKNGEQHLYEAVFQHERVLVISDVVEKTDDGWKIYEVKSSAKISETYINDAAVQYWVIKGMGYKINKFFLVHMDTSYTKQGDIDLNKMFKNIDVTEEVISRQERIENQISIGKETLNLKSSPKIDIGKHCFTPYPCDFYGHCHKHIPKKSVFDLIETSFEEQMNLYDQGVVKIDEIEEEKLSQNQKKQIDAIINEKTIIDTKNLQKWSQDLSKSFQAIHLLSTFPAQPVFEETNPYQKLFFSALIGNDDTATKTFISSNNHNPTLSLFDFLNSSIDPKIPILCFNRQILIEDLKSIESQKKSKFDFQISDLKIYDLSEPIRRLWFYDYKLGNDFSLESIFSKLSTSGSKAIKIFPKEQLAGVDFEMQLQAFPEADYSKIEEYIQLIYQSYQEVISLFKLQ